MSLINSDQDPQRNRITSPSDRAWIAGYLAVAGASNPYTRGQQIKAWEIGAAARQRHSVADQQEFAMRSDRHFGSRGQGYAGSAWEALVRQFSE